MDRLLITLQVMLGALGVVGVATRAPDEAFGHAVRVAIALGLTFVVGRLKARHVVRASPMVFVTLLALLVLVLIVGVSPAGSESKRWLVLPFLGFTLQPSEFMKVAVIAYLAAFFHNHLGNWEIWRPMLVIGLTAAAIVAEPDVSTALFIFVLAFAIMVTAGTTLTRLASITTAAALIAALIAGPYLSQFGYLRDRIAGFQDLWGMQERVDDEAYQQSMAREAMLRGGVLGIGPGRQVPVPAAQTDFVSIAIAQALGLIGTATLVTLYMLIAGRGLRISAAVEGPSALLAAGATAYICGQAGLNLLVATGLLPVTGIPLPFVSYGFNSLLSVAIAFGFLHIASRQARNERAAAPAHEASV